MRTPMVTRTISRVNAKVLCVNTANGEAYTTELILPYSKDKKVILKSAKKIVDDLTNMAVSISSYEIEEKLYGMTEDKFIEMAEILPSRM